MDLYTKLKDSLKQREIAILSMERKLNVANRLNRTLLEALQSSVSTKDILSYDERTTMRKDTDRLCKAIIAVEETEVNQGVNIL